MEFKKNDILVNHRQEQIKKHLSNLYSASMRPFLEKSKHKNFLTCDEFKENSAEVLSITYSHMKIKEKLTQQST